MKINTSIYTESVCFKELIEIIVGWTGADCDQDIVECNDPTFCHGGRCVNKMGGYSCECPEGLSGSQCRLDEDECFFEPCNGFRVGKRERIELTNDPALRDHLSRRGDLKIWLFSTPPCSKLKMQK